MNSFYEKSKESGQVLLVVALLLVCLAAMLALALDGGSMYLYRRAMQNAADAGALAGARVLVLNGTNEEARAAVQEYAVQRNGADSCTTIVDSAGITVTACANVPMTFARVIGLEQATVCALAAARFKPVGTARNLAPIAIRDFNWQFNVPYTIWDDETDQDPYSGNISGSYRGWLNLPCVYPLSCGDAGASELKNWMQNGYQGITQVDTWIRGSSGVKASTIAEAQVGQVLRIAVYDNIQDKYQNQAYYHVVKFAAFRVTQVYASGNPKGIKGVFEYAFVPGPPSQGADGGVRMIGLTQ